MLQGRFCATLEASSSIPLVLQSHFWRTTSDSPVIWAHFCHNLYQRRTSLFAITEPTPNKHEYTDVFNRDIFCEMTRISPFLF